MPRWHHDEETGIDSSYALYIEGIEVDFNDSWWPGATISLYEHDLLESGERELLFTTIDCPQVLHWTPPKLHPLWGGYVVEIEYWEDGYMRREELVSEKEADEIASRAVYDERDEAHIAVPRTLSVGTSTVWIKVERVRFYPSSVCLDVSFCVEFASLKECTRFLDEDIRKLEHRFIYGMHCDVGVIDDITRALKPLSGDLDTAHDNAVRRSIPFSQFEDEYPQPEKQLIRHRASNRGDDRPCFLTLHLSTENFYRILRVDWSATTIPPTFPSPSGAFQALNNVHLKFPSPVSHDRNHSSSSQSHQDDLTISITASEISFSAGTDSVSLGNGFTLSSKHRTINVNYINTISGDVFLAPISRSNIGGTNNVNSIRTSSPVGSRSPRLTWSLPRPHRSTPLLQEQPESQAGVGRWVQPRPSRPKPY